MIPHNKITFFTSTNKQRALQYKLFQLSSVYKKYYIFALYLVNKTLQLESADKNHYHMLMIFQGAYRDSQSRGVSGAQ